ncbi:ABC transporter substrate-binding protein [Microbacterium sp. ASV81]|uniref:ABC transporter substrate-binding protein n=1 Tax=Microbacterium capsulatum TaxID=3041921 RepID=A0ABU0XBQ8_9MICO|nr:ABC transporter substrate-binding protein [Microbacterium sp. ASV81]MDQ4212552.1 ABC transporter substrate-binding protein [Microbacterium sp. ASV81]
MEAEKKKKLRIACAHDLAYTPQYVGAELGFFEDQGLALEFVPHPAGVAGVVDTVRLGSADLVLGSLVYALRMHETGTDTHIVAQSNQQTRNVLMSRREDDATFRWADLRRRSIVLYPGEAPTAWAAFQEALHRHDLTTGDMQLIIGFTAADAVEEFVRGVGDYLFIDAEAALDDRLRCAATVADGAGALPWSIYSTSAEVAAARSEDLIAFRRGLGEAQRWMLGHSASDIADVIGHRFPRYTRARLVQILERYLELNLWPDSADVRMDQILRWEGALRRNGLITTRNPVTEYLSIHAESLSVHE